MPPFIQGFIAGVRDDRALKPINHGPEVTQVGADKIRGRREMARNECVRYDLLPILDCLSFRNELEQVTITGA